ncbi:MAG: cytochrome c3 family protein [Ignavibacteriaceae bacterium]|nr:cytochrome c3 family protein [Ignavibacteriaceae bacterium]
MKLKYTLFYLLIPLTGILLFVASTANSSGSGMQGNKSIIKFSHKLHKDATDCESCHAAVKTSKSLSDRLLPNHDNCKDCHDVNDEKTCKTCHFDNVNEPLIQNKSELIFNHSSHINQQKLKCETCHKGVNDVEYAEDAPQALPSMETCYTCHNNGTATSGKSSGDTTKVKITASNACETCHISTADLKPQSHKSSSFIKSHKFAAREFNANCIMCHDNASCQECHTSTTMITGQNTSKDFYRPYTPSNSGTGAQQQQINRVHNLNYVYTHGIDAKGKTSECQSCHETESFCVSCHQGKEGDYSMGGVAPYSHLRTTFMVLGVGSGGGDHATLARRDIESCASCHDVQGGDPICISCHTDPDGIKGTNPKTHPSNYMRDTHGDWHDSQGSVCFNCHTGFSPSSQPGVGFCGYCHGHK